MQYDYLATVQYTGSINIENIGNCCLQALNDFGRMWILSITTNDGITEIIEYGPIQVDIEKLDDEVYYTYRRIQFDMKKIDRIIDMFLNNGKRCISQVLEISFEEAKELIVSMIDKIGG